MPSYCNKLLTAAALVGVAAGAIGCAETNSTIFIQQAQAITSSASCVVSADPESVARGSGSMDYALHGTKAYSAALLIGNQLIRRGDEKTLRVETARVQLYEAEVEVFDFSGGSLSNFTLPVSGFADASTSDTPGYGVAFVTLIDPSVFSHSSLGATPSQTLVSRVKVFGVSLGGEEVETGYWDYPIDVCDGCQVASCIEPAACDDDVFEVCELGQDELPDCRKIDDASCCDPDTPPCTI